jgi:hypothetical protein
MISAVFHQRPRYKENTMSYLLENMKRIIRAVDLWQVRCSDLLPRL